MDSEQKTGASGDLAERGIQYTMEQCNEIMSQTEDYVRANPTKALLYAAGAGFILDRLPIFRIFGALVRLLLMALKPAILIYGATKLYEIAKGDE